MFNERTAIGLDVHARSVRAAALDTSTGELIEARLPPGNDAVAAWVADVAKQHGPVAVWARSPRPQNTHARRLLIEAAWHHKPLYRPGKTMTDRWAKAPAQAATRGDAGNRRLHYRWSVMSAHKKKHTIACTAIARELAGWCWSLAVMDL